MKFLWLTVIVLCVIACTGNDEPEAQAEAAAPAGQPGWPVSPDSPVAVTRQGPNGDLESALDGLTGKTREAALELVAGAKAKRREAAEWLGKAIETEKQAREYQAANDEQGAGSARETAADYRRRAREILAQARADEASVLALAHQAVSDDGAGPAEQQ